MIDPKQPDWDLVDSAILAALVANFVDEPSCAGIAVSRLGSRRHGRTVDLAQWLLTQERADKWPNAAACAVLVAE